MGLYKKRKKSELIVPIKKIVVTTKTKEVHKFDIVYVDLGEGVGSEQNSIRPCVVVSNDVGNTFSPVVMIAPITKKDKHNNLPTRVLLGNNFGLKCKSWVMCEQMRTVDKMRLLQYVGNVDIEQVQRQINKALRITLGIGAEEGEERI